MTQIALRNMTVMVKKHILLENVAITVNDGETVWLRGPNGSGKSTVLKLMAGLLRAQTGTVLVNGQALLPGHFLANAGVIINTPVFIPSLSGFANLQMLAAIRHMISDDDIRQWMQRLGLNPQDRMRVRQYSTGMNQKLGIIQAVMEKPVILLLDEPLNGLDKAAKQQVIDLLRTMQQETPNLTMVMVSHEEEIAPLVTRRLLIDGLQVIPDDDQQ